LGGARNPGGYFLARTRGVHEMSRFQQFVVLVGFGVLLSLIGCGRGDYPETVSVTGRVTLDGQPLPDAIVTFMPVDGQRSGSGTTDARGAFSLSTFQSGDGAVPGDHQVAIMPSEPPPMPGGSGEEDFGERAPTAPYSPPFPARYGLPTTSGLAVTVSRDQKNDFTFDLEAD